MMTPLNLLISSKNSFTENIYAEIMFQVSEQFHQSEVVCWCIYLANDVILEIFMKQIS